MIHLLNEIILSLDEKCTNVHSSKDQMTLPTSESLELKRKILPKFA